MPVNTKAREFCGYARCFAPQSLKRLGCCENGHPWSKQQAVGPDEVLAYYKTRLVEVNRQIEEAQCWGAHLAELGSEQRGLVGTVAYWEKKASDVQV